MSCVCLLTCFVSSLHFFFPLGESTTWHDEGVKEEQEVEEGWQVAL
jgi:hypothetical protein